MTCKVCGAADGDVAHSYWCADYQRRQADADAAYKRGVQAAFDAVNADPVPEPTGDVHFVYLARIKVLLDT